MVAERWHWSHEEIRALGTGQRREYVEVISDLYQREKEQIDRIKAQSNYKRSRR